ncbi:MAG: PIN domain-containing protein [Planctomycetota bacterium]
MRNKTFLLDTNAVQAWLNEDNDFQSNFRAISTGGDRVFTCPIVIGEIYAGHLLTTTTNAGARMAFEQGVRQRIGGKCLEVRSSTGKSYAKLVEAIVDKYPRNIKTSKATSLHKHLCALGVGINDLWIAAIALDRNAILVTSDNMSKIVEAGKKLQPAAFRVVNWKSP